MLVRTMEDLEAQGRVISINQGASSAVRLFTKADGLGLSLSEARGSAGGTANLWYKNHWEANYVRQGTGTLENRTTGETWALKPGVLYCVGPTDKHRLVNDGSEGFRIISVFNPPLVGGESHDADGSYPPTGEVPPGQPAMFVRTWADAEAAGHVVVKEGGSPRWARLLTARDGLGFTLSDVRFKAGQEMALWYKNHWEVNIVLDGLIEVTDHGTGQTHRIGPGAAFAVGPRDRHHVRIVADSHVLSIFNPPLHGTELHDADGSYPPTGPVPEGPKGR